MKRLHIENFKCLKDFEIKDLKRVNLFTGRNNTGKSTLLEAISISATNGHLFWIHRLLDKRGEASQLSNNQSKADTNIKLFSSLFNGRSSDFFGQEYITIFAPEDGSIKMGFVKYIEGKVFQKIDGEEVRIGTKKVIVKDEGSENVEFGLLIKNTKTATIFPIVDDIFEKHITPQNAKTFNFIDTNGVNYVDPSALWDKITLTEKENNVIEALQIVEPLIERISFVGEIGNGGFRYPVVKLVNDDEKYPLKSMGEGINRIMNIILALVNSENGYILIDEFENGLHYSVQEKLWEVIFKTAEKLNVQVFATTHSTDTINSFAKVIGKEKNHEGSLYRMANVKDKIKAYNFSKEEIIRAANQQINLR